MWWEIVSRTVSKKSLIAFQFLNFILQNWWFKMYSGNQNQRLRKLAVERRRKEGYWFSKYLATLHWSTTLNETIEINRSISLSVSFVIFRFYCHSLNKNNGKNRNLNGPLLDFRFDKLVLSFGLVIVTRRFLYYPDSKVPMNWLIIFNAFCTIS